MGLFNDTITIYQKQTSGSWKRTTVEGVQWSDMITKSMATKSMATGKLEAAKTTTITFPEEVLDKIDLSTFGEEDTVVYGAIDKDVTDVSGNRISDLIRTYPKSGIIRSVNDNTNRDLLKNIKVVIY